MAQEQTPVTNLNKLSLAHTVADRASMSQSSAYDVTETVFDVVANNVARGGSISVTNFGTFTRVKRPARYARNPQTGERVLVPERYVIKFVPSARLTEFANSDTPEATTIRKRPKGPAAK